MEIFFTILYSILFLIIIRNHKFFRIDGIRNEALRSVFLIKIGCGILLYLIYSYYYTDRATADIFKYYDDSKIMYNSLFHKPIDFFKMLFGVQNDTPYFTNTYYTNMNNWFRIYDSNIFSDSHLIIRFNAFVMLFSFGHFNVHTVFVCFLSFWGLTAMLKFFISYAPKCKFGLFISVFLIPSVLFWGSGVLKEGLIFFALGMLLYLSDNFFEKFSVLNFIMILLSILILLYTKIYIFLLISPLIVILKLLKFSNQSKVSIAFFSVYIFVFFVGYLSLKMLANIDVLTSLAQKQNDFVMLAKSQPTGSLLNDNMLCPQWFCFVQEIPNAIVNTFFRPLIGLDNSPMMIPSAIENIVFLGLLIISFIAPSKLNRSQKMLFHLSLWFVIGVFLLTGITTPILGAIVRYKAIALPFLGVIFSLTLNKRKIYRSSHQIARWLLYFEKKIIYKSVIH